VKVACCLTEPKFGMGLSKHEISQKVPDADGGGAELDGGLETVRIAPGHTMLLSCSKRGLTSGEHSLVLPQARGLALGYTLSPAGAGFGRYAYFISVIPISLHSDLSATIGSTFAARRAGI
jgi:hypothetical protein